MMTGRITILGISRWSEKDGSNRTIQRFFAKKEMAWGLLNWLIVKAILIKNTDVILIAGDATTVTKSGHATHGLGKFFSSIYGRAIPSIAFQTLSLISVKSRKSWPILLEQILPKAKEEKVVADENAEKKIKRGKGRPKGSKNKNHRNPQLNSEMLQVQKMLKQLLKLIKNSLNPVYFIYDGAFGHNAAIRMTRQVDLHLISKLRHNSALYDQPESPYSGRGRPKIYGNKIDLKKLPEKHLKSEKIKNNILTQTYQMTTMHKKCADKLNVVIICKKNLKTDKQARTILFSTDLQLSHEYIIDYYSLRFQIEFNFRDAKQHWGLEDFMVTAKTQVYNAANLSIWMVNLSQAMLANNQTSILDLKAHHHALRYAREAFKMLPQSTKLINIKQLLMKIPVLGRIHEDKMVA